MRNSGVILDTLAASTTLEGLSLLDVGCGHGWFLEQAGARGIRALGLEPDTAVSPGVEGLDIRAGSFPESVDSSDRYDVIVFNDVFEHLADPVAVLDACHRRIAPGGKLVLNLPDSRGALFRTACALSALGISGPLERLWQNDYPSPHIFYYDANNLERMASGQGFRLLHTQPLATLHASGLWSRLRFDRRAGILRTAFVWSTLLAAYPVLACLHSDILLQIYEKRT